MTGLASGARLDTPVALQRFMRADYPLSDQQFAAVTAPLAPAVVIAGAGSGKTTLMAARVLWLVGTGQVQPHEVLGLTFTTKAAGELTTRVREGLRRAGVVPDPAQGPRAGEPDVVEPTIGTYHSYAAGLLGEQGLRIGHEPGTRVIADAARFQLAARVIARHRRPVARLSDHPPTVMANLLALDAQISEHLLTPDEVRSLHDRLTPRIRAAALAEPRKTYRGPLEAALDAFARREELLHLVEEYRRLKSTLGLMEFSDQIELGARLAESCPEVGEQERARFRVVLLDEYQDTSSAQARMLSAIFSGADADHGRGHPVMAVGDPNQAIYGWRGASVSNIRRFGEAFPAADGSTDVASYSLTVNRRSDRLILELANRLAGPLAATDAGGRSLVARLEPAPSAAVGTIRAEVHETYDEELAALVGGVRDARAAYGAWSSVGVLTRDNSTAADVFNVLSEAEVPVEIVGLTGLLELPEVAEVVATLTILQDLTADADLLTVLAGPRWAIGPRDLALLGARAHELAGGRRRGRGEPGRSVGEELAEVVGNVDEAEVPSLCEALADPGEGPYSTEALERFALLADELRRLRAHVGEPLLDLVRRVIDTIGIDVELASSVSPAAAARRDNLDLFVKGVADFQAIDGEVSLAALVAYLKAEDESGAGLDVATPTAADTVKLLTVHRAKGLEWDAVFVVGVSRERFPNTQGRAKWTTSPAVLPTPLRGDAVDLPAVTDWTGEGLAAYAEAVKAHERLEELRLGYVAFTRPRHLLHASGATWTSTRKTPCGPSPFLETVRDFLTDAAAAGEPGVTVPTWPPAPEKGAANPLLAAVREVPWPASPHTAEVGRRRDAAAMVRAAMAELSELAELAEPSEPSEPSDLGEPAERVERGEPPVVAASSGRPDVAGGDDPVLDEASAALVSRWDRDIARLLDEARRRRSTRVEVPLPASLSATAVAALRDDPSGFAAALARPMPQPPSPAARNGTRFHAWVERHYQQGRQELLVDPDELSGRADVGVDDDEDLAGLVAAFEASPFAHRRPMAIEPAFSVVIGGQVVRGRIDAVFADDDGQVTVVDWKTGRTAAADPLQLAVYRVAWSQLHGVEPSRIRGAFFHVRLGLVEVFDDLPDADALAALLSAATSAAVGRGPDA